MTLNKYYNKGACFNYKNYLFTRIKKCVYCLKYKLDNIVDIHIKHCLRCKIKLPDFNYKDKKITLYCRDCKVKNMVDSIDIRYKIRSKL
jgi:hypothetical protein